MRRRFPIAVLALTTGLLAAPVAARAQTREADNEAVRKLQADFFEAWRQGGAAGVLAHLRQSGSLDADGTRALEPRLRAAEAAVGRSDSYALVAETEITHALRFRSAVFLTYHDTGPVAWRLRFYRKVTGVWIINSVQVEQVFVEDFLQMSEVEFAAYRSVLNRLPTLETLERLLRERNR